MNIMIIEDEQIERETLYKILQEEFSECEEIYAARNGREALALFELHHPDIILADINIPGINGLEVIRRIKQEHSDVEFLILSSYNYFEYAQEAIRLGVNDFILKPYNLTHLKEAVRKLMNHIQRKEDEKKRRSELLEKIEKITPVLETECLYAILSNEEELVLRKKLRMLNPRICSGFCFIVKSARYDPTHNEEIAAGFRQLGFRCLKELFHELQIFYILAERAIEQNDIKRLCAYMEDLRNQYVCGIGPIENQAAKFHASYQAARERIGDDSEIASLLIHKDAQQQEESLDMEAWAKTFFQIMQRMDEEGLKKAMHQMTLRLLPQTKEQITEAVKQLFHTLQDLLQEEYPQLHFDAFHIEPLSIMNNVHQEVPLYLHMQLHRFYDPIVEERFKNTNQLVRQALRYIDANYRRQITLSDIANALQVSPFYLSKLLNTSLHKTFTELVSEKRVEAAKELLRDGKRIKEIAFEVGFQGQNYFTKIFKKYTGMTPKIYKNTFESES